jgi:hypothetical protein
MSFQHKNEKKQHNVDNMALRIISIQTRPRNVKNKYVIFEAPREYVIYSPRRITYPLVA